MPLWHLALSHSHSHARALSTCRKQQQTEAAAAAKRVGHTIEPNDLWSRRTSLAARQDPSLPLARPYEPPPARVAAQNPLLSYIRCVWQLLDPIPLPARASSMIDGSAVYRLLKWIFHAAIALAPTWPFHAVASQQKSTCRAAPAAGLMWQLWVIYGGQGNEWRQLFVVASSLEPRQALINLSRIDPNPPLSNRAIKALSMCGRTGERTTRGGSGRCRGSTCTSPIINSSSCAVSAIYAGTGSDNCIRRRANWLWYRKEKSTSVGQLYVQSALDSLECIYHTIYIYNPLTELYIYIVYQAEREKPTPCKKFLANNA